MPNHSIQHDELKRKIRTLKKLETQIRFGNTGLAEKTYAAELVWNAFPDLHEVGRGKARYSIQRLSAMNKEEYRSVIDEFFFRVYDRFYRENGIVNIHFYDPDILSQLGLPFDADVTTIKKRFRELAMRYHPDTGGDATKFVELMENYRKLIEKRRS